MVFKVGDFVCGKSNVYMITNKKMTKAEVIEIAENYNEIKIKIIKHLTLKSQENGVFWVSACDFEKTRDITEDFLLKGGD